MTAMTVVTGNDRVLRALLSIAIAVAVLLVPAMRASAQGTSGSLPSPINSQQLMRYADLLDLSGPQRLAMEAAHDEYRIQFRGLRDGEIAAFLEKQRSMQGGIPKRDAVEKLLESQQHLQSKIDALDNRLFDQILPILTDQQQSMVPRLRLARERQRYEVQATQAAFGRRTVDLSDLFHDLDLSPEEFTSADAMIASYERRMTTLMRKQNKALVRMTMDLMDGLAQRGYEEMSQEELLKNAELLQELLGEIQQIYGELRENVTKLSDDIRELNDRTYRQVAAAIPPDQARRFRNLFYRDAYPQLGPIVEQSGRHWMVHALKLDDLTAEQRSELELASDEHQRRLDQILDAGVADIDGFWEKFSPFELNQDIGDELRNSLSNLRAKALDAEARADGTVELNLGEDAVAELRASLAKVVSEAESTATAAAAASGADEEGADPAAAAFPGIDRFLPDRISRRDIDRYMKQLQIERDMSAVLDALHLDYIERLRTLDVFDRLREARDAPGLTDDGGAKLSPADRQARVIALRREAVDAMIAVDAAFFDDLGALVGEDHENLLERVHASRLRRAYTGSASARLALGRHNSNEASVDVISIVLEQQPSEVLLARLDETFAEYEAGAAPAFRARLEAQLELQRITDQWLSEIETAAREDVATVIELQNRYREEMRRPAERVADTDRVIVELNRRALGRVLGEAPDELAASMQRAYDLAAFPSIYDDAAAIDRHLAAARKLEDLTAGQRDQLTELAGAYRGEYAQLSRQMIEHLGTSPVNVVGLDPDSMREWQGRQQQVAKFRFDRNELNGRAISRMRAILDAEQIRRIGGLPEPLGEDELFFYR